MKNIVTIKAENGKILATPEERMDGSLFKAFRSEGWLWSRYAGAFMFNDNENGARRVRRLFNGGLSTYYGLTADGKAEAAEMVFAYADEQTEQHINALLAAIDEQAAAAKAEQEQKKEKTIANKMAQVEKILAATKDLPNGFKPSLTYGFMNPITSTAEFFERGGVLIQESIPALCEKLGVNIPEGLSLDNSDILTLKIKFDFREAGYRTEAHRDIVLIAEYGHSDGKCLTCTSGNFDAKIILNSNLKQRTLSAYREYAEICDDEIKRDAIQLYFNYCRANGAKAITVSMFERAAGNGSITLEQLKQVCGKIPA